MYPYPYLTETRQDSCAKSIVVLSELDNLFKLSLLLHPDLWIGGGIFQTIANTNEASPAEYVIPEGETIQ